MGTKNSASKNKAVDPELVKQLAELKSAIDILTSACECDMLEEFHTAGYIEMIQNKKEKYVLAVQKTKIQEQKGKRGNGSNYVVYAARPNGESKYMKASTYDGLINKLYDYYTGSTKTPTLGEIFTDATLWKSQRGVSGKTIVEYKRIWGSYFADDPIAKVELEKLDVHVLTEFYDRMVVTHKMTFSQLQNLRNVMSYLMAYCIKKKLINHNPAKDVDYSDFPYAKTSGRKDKIKKTPFPPDKIPEIIQTCKDFLSIPRVNVLHPLGIIVGVQLADRYGELCGMRWSNINFAERTITIDDQSVPVYTINDDLTYKYEGRKPAGHIKGYEEPVPIPIPTEAFNALLQIKALGLSDEFVFPENHFRINTLNNYVKKVAKALGLNPVKYSSHSLRATAATDLYLRTHDVFLVQRLLHHTTPEMTMRYIKDLDIDERLRKVMFDDFVRQNSVPLGNEKQVTAS